MTTLDTISSRIRRDYLREQMENAAAMLEGCMDYPVEECLEPLLPLADAAREAGVRVDFATTPIAGDLPRIFALRRELIPGFIGAAETMNRRGWILRVEDGFRSREMQRAVALKPAVFDSVLARLIAERDGHIPTPEFMLQRLTTMCVTIPKIGTHMSGSALDISVVDEKTQNEVNRGGPYLEISEKTAMASPFISPDARRNREEITAIFSAQGWVPYPFEFWHYSDGDAYKEILTQSGRPARYGAVDWNPADGSVTPIRNPKESLQSIPAIQDEIRAALQRLRKG